jgi:hypothetical protein
MKYIVTVSLAMLCFAGLCRWIAERIADRRDRGPDHDRRHFERRRTHVLNGNQTNMPAAAPIAPNNNNIFSGILGEGSRGLRCS